MNFNLFPSFCRTSTTPNFSLTKPAKRLLGLLFVCLTLQGCVVATVAVVAGGISVANDRRTLGKQIDDQSIEFSAYNDLEKNKAISDNTNIQLVSVNGTVLLVGQSPNTYLRDLVIKTVKQTQSVIKIHDQIRIGKTTSVTTQSNDIWLTSKAKSALFSNDASSFNHIKVVTENGEVFLLGLVTEQEAKQAVDVVRKLSGVAKVFRAFEIINADT
ncbi:MAG: BON domain-containing protein [Colwellia sp.]